MLLNQQLQGILYLVFEGNLVFNVYAFKCSTNATYDIRWCAAYDCGALWLLNFQDGGEGSRK